MTQSAEPSDLDYQYEGVVSYDAVLAAAWEDWRNKTNVPTGFQPSPKKAFEEGFFAGVEAQKEYQL